MNTENLLKLAAYLLSGNLKAEFNMNDFCVPFTAYSTDCGTAGCAAGHGPHAGIPKQSSESWVDYSGRVFIPTMDARWDWCFSSSWTGTDNTPEGAGKRILYLLKHGLPGYWAKQMHGEEPLCYLNETL